MGRLFGTDGVRGVAGEDLTGKLAMDLATAAAGMLRDMRAARAAGRSGARLVAVVGRDPRASGEFLEAAVVAGLAGTGVDVLRLGVIPTPGVAFLTAELGADIGVMLSASHNPAPDNGIKLFGRGGFKLPDAAEDEIEARMASPGRAGLPGGVPAGGFGRVRDARGERERYLAHLLASQPGVSDLGAFHGAPARGARVASALAPVLLRRAGADVIAIGAEPDGENINAGCGSTHLEALSAAVLKHGADAGIAHDGDADRCLAVDAEGEIVDGDQILAILTLELKARGLLAGDTVVATVMSNLGFRKAMAQAGVTLVETAVGDRYVLEAMRAGDFVLGGEQSGHIIMLDHATTGDGMLTALHLLAAAVRQGTTLAGLVRVMTRYPQVLVNVPGVDKERAARSPELAAAVTAAKAELGAAGRVLVRPSGTEPAVRVMVEATDHEHAQRLAGGLAATIRAL